METTIAQAVDPAELRKAMVATLTDSGHLRAPAIIDAFRDIERHHFAPDAAVRDAYVDDAVSVKHDQGGEMISCISAPSIVATQLEQLGARPGHKVLEAGPPPATTPRSWRAWSLPAATCGPWTSTPTSSVEPETA
ncbi:hypothetical protein ACQPYK_49910 (plasmid) [Streptosporangium sp. CA-135522]|uniref:hypothetical protein n=1 Tax=Streptosporangium sp. CA-135522 TaxID=3240072 RepID=UPI003D8C3705